jgi:hypothetical protein
MRNFNIVVNTMIANTQDAKLLNDFKIVNLESRTSAPEVIWDIYGRRISDLLYNYARVNSGAFDPWFSKVMSIFTEKNEELCLEYIKSVHNS